MKKLGLIVGLALASAAANANVILGPPTTALPSGPPGGGLPAGPWSLVVPFTTDFRNGPATLYADANWTFSIWDGSFGPFSFVQIEIQHLSAHPGEALPGPISTLAVLFPVSVGAGGISYGSVQHHVPGPGGGDDFVLEVTVNSDLTGSGTVRAWHTEHRNGQVPDASSSVMLLGLGLLALGGARRFVTI